MSPSTGGESTLEEHGSAGLLAESEALFTSIGDGAIATDEFGRVIRVNPAGLDILEYSEEEILGEWFPKVIIALDETLSPLSLIDRPITQAFLTGKTINQKMLYRTKSGSFRPVSVTVSPILLDNRPIGAIEVFRDITVEENIDRMKSEFISLASHQLRTPLSAVKTYAHMLMEGYMGDLVPAQKKALKTILSASNRMNELVNMLLNVTRVESGSLAITSKSHNLQRLAEEVIREVELAATEKSIDLKLEVPKKPVSVKTDNLLAKEILINLLSNAIKYTPGGGSVSLRLSSRADSVVFTVTDSGLGIPAYSQEHIFTKFFRAQNVVKQETTGTGLGLYLVKGLSDALGGKVWFSSEENVGSKFYFSLPKNIRSRRQSQKRTAKA